MSAMAKRNPDEGQDSAFLRRLAAMQSDAEARSVDADDSPRLEAVPEDPRVEAMVAYFHASLRESRSEHFAGASLDDLTAEQFPMVFRRMLDGLTRGNPSLKQMVLAGRTSRGKTHALAAFGNAAARMGKTVRFVDHLTYLEWLRPDGSDTPDWKIEKKFRECEVLLLNDLGAEFNPDVPASEFVRKHTLRLVDDRLYTPRQVTLVSTNATAKDLSTMFGARLLERLGEKGGALKFTGQSWRGDRLDF